MIMQLKFEAGYSRWQMGEVLLSLLLLAFSACSPCTRLSRRCAPLASVTDSVYVFDTLVRELRVVDTVQSVRLMPESVYVMAPFKDTVYATTVYARAMAWMEGERVCLRVWNKDSAAVLTQKIVTLERQLAERGRIRTEVRMQTVYQTRGVVKLLAWIGGLLLLYMAGKAVIKLVLRYSRFM